MYYAARVRAFAHELYKESGGVPQIALSPPPPADVANAAAENEDKTDHLPWKKVDAEARKPEDAQSGAVKASVRLRHRKSL